MSRCAGEDSLPETQFKKAPPGYHQLNRGVCNNIGDILVKVRGSGVKVRFWTPFWQGNWRSYGKSAQPKSGQTDFCGTNLNCLSKSAGVASQTLSVIGTLLAGPIETNV